MKTCLNADTFTARSHTTSWWSVNLHHSTDQLEPVIFHPSLWQSNSTIPAYQSSSIPAGGEIHTFPSSHPPHLLVVKLAPFCQCFRSFSLDQTVFLSIDRPQNPDKILNIRIHEITPKTCKYKNEEKMCRSYLALSTHSFF